MSVGAYSEDDRTHIVNVHWGHQQVIVVFMEVSPWNPQPVFTLTRKGDTATFLSTWNTPSYSTDPAPFRNTAYQVDADAGVFLKSTAPDIPDDVNGTWLNVLVFAIENDDLDASLNRAIENTKLMAPAIYIANATLADLPSEVAPPGLLWGVTTGDFLPGVTLEWKMRYGEHRNSVLHPPPPPNSMVQCYPLAVSHPGYIGEFKVTYTGYFLVAYRLDDDGTGDVYSISPKSTDVDVVQNLPPEWNVRIVSGSTPLYGIPFADPPPLISADVP